MAGKRVVEIADELLGRYRTLGTLFRAFADPAHHDDHLPLVVERHLRCVARAFLTALSIDAVEGRIIRSSKALIAYLRFDMAPLSREHFRVLYLDGANHLVADRVLWTGTVDAVQAHPREIISVALQVGATALILVHNHPTGSAMPSDHDLEITARITSACAAVDIVVHDHIIVGRGPAHSMRSAGQISKSGAPGTSDSRDVAR